jgi:hypothetical protein
MNPYSGSSTCGDGPGDGPGSASRGGLLRINACTVMDVMLEAALKVLPCFYAFTVHTVFPGPLHTISFSLMTLLIEMLYETCNVCLLFHKWLAY